MNQFPAAFLLFALSFVKISVVGYIDPDFQKAIESLQDQNFTEEQLITWFYKERAKQRNYPRVFPFCYDPDIKLPKVVEKYIDTFKAFRSVIAYNPSLYSWLAKANDSLVPWDSIKPQRIQIRRGVVNPAVFNGEEGSVPMKMQQWIHVKVEFTKPIQGLYVQAIVGPLGIPSGEFALDFVCNEGDMDSANWKQRAFVEPCHFAPRSAYSWPNVFIYDTGNCAGCEEKVVTFRYRWTETHCHETGFFQFIMIANYNHGLFHPILSPIFYLNDLDSLSAVASPYHPYYDKIECGLEHAPLATITEFNNGWRIIPSKSYDDCVLNGTGRGATNTSKDTCPPGHFQCSTFWNTSEEWKDLVGKWWKETIIAPISDCCELRIPFSPQEEANSLKKQHETILLNRTLEYEKTIKITHGDFCVLVWLIMTPIANYCARFFKDFADIEGCGLGFWFIAHAVLHSLGFVLVWSSFGLVVGSGEDKLGNISGTHFFLGMLLSVIQHYQFITGLRRTGEEHKTFNYVLTHSLFGYMSQAVAYLCVFLSKASTVRKYASGVYFGCWVVTGLTFHFVELAQDKMLGVVLHRALCPVLQRVTIIGGTPPLGKLKIAVLILTCILNIAIFSCIILLDKVDDK